MTMNKLNYYAPLAIGIDRFFTEVENAIKGNTTYPPHNVIKDGEDSYGIELAVAGFSRDQISIETQDRLLKITGEAQKDEREYTYKGISTRSFTRQFTLAEYVEVTDATLQDGILSVSLKRNVPEEKQPRKVKIG
jgi:molecular chaperone IbpA